MNVLNNERLVEAFVRICPNGVLSHSLLTAAIAATHKSSPVLFSQKPVAYESRYCSSVIRILMAQFRCLKSDCQLYRITMATAPLA